VQGAESGRFDDGSEETGVVPGTVILNGSDDILTFADSAESYAHQAEGRHQNGIVNLNCPHTSLPEGVKAMPTSPIYLRPAVVLPV
jgi:hypothetical protein